MEYALVTATIAAAIVGALGGVGRTLPATVAQQEAAITRAANGVGIPASEARRAARAAPYTRPTLRTLYGLGWVVGRAGRAGCSIAVSTDGATEQVARDVLRGVPALAKRLRAARVTQREAVRAVDRGYRAACS